MDPIASSTLHRTDPRACAQLRTQLIERGYAVISINDAQTRESLHRAVHPFEPEQTFRFPARDGISHYDEIQRACFQILYGTAVACTKALWACTPELQAGFPEIATKIEATEHPDFQLFGGADSNSPFASPDAPFAHTFFNIFNYDHGMLNDHKDRGVVTAIYIAPGSTNGESVSQLWVSRNSEDWVAMDSLVDGGQLIIFVGEELEEMSKRVGLDFLAANHNVRVSPRGDYVSHSHSRRDPDANETGNRRSAALILCS